MRKKGLYNLKTSLRSLGLLIKRHPAYLIVEIIDLICSTIKMIIPIQLSGSLVRIFQDSNGSFNEALKITLFYVAILVITTSISAIVELVIYLIHTHFKLFFATSLFRKVTVIDYDFHEQENFLDNYTRALDNGAEQIYTVANNQIGLIKQVIQSISIFSIIVTSNYAGVVYAVCIGILFYLIRKIDSKLNYERVTKERPFMRERMYLRRVYFVKDAIPDIKTSGINDVLIDKHEGIANNLENVNKKYLKKIVIFRVICDVLISTIYPVLLIVSVRDVLLINDVALLTQLTVAATQISSLVSGIADKLSHIQASSLEAQVPFEVLEMESKIEGVKGIDDINGFEKLEISNMSFGYTDDKMILKDINMSIKKGEKIAIVGENGAGKTTLVKLLLRLYDPQNGDVFYNNYNYKELETKPLRQKVGAVFQNSEVYSVSVAENVLLRKVENEEDRELAIEALKFSGLYDHIMTLENGIDTIVTKEFNRNGKVFSGGQQQKLAVARGYAQNYDLFILDEPSSALDPIAETEMYKNMLSLGKEKTLIFISHRLSATANVDRIFLFENGRILESGTHSELMKIPNGRYYEMFSSQAEKYLGGDEND